MTKGPSMPASEVSAGATPPNRRGRALVAALLGAAVLAGLGWAWHWHTHPAVFPSSGNGISWESSRERTLFIAATYPYPGDGERVTIEAVSPRVLESTGASFEFFVCTVDLEGADVGAIGAVNAREFEQMCPDAVPAVAGTELDVGAAVPQQLVMGVSVERSAILRTAGIDLTYRHGWQRGTQDIGEHLTVLPPRPR